MTSLKDEMWKKNLEERRNSEEDEIVHPIADALDMEPMPVTEVVVVEPDPEIENEIERDYQFARANMIDILSKGSQSLEEIMDVAKTMESPRAYEVVANLLKTLVDTNKDLVDMTTKKAKLQGEVSNNPQQVTHNNAIYVGSTKELQDLIAKRREDSED